MHWTQKKTNALFCREIDWWHLRPLRNFHLDFANSNCGQQLCGLLQKPIVEKWSGAKEARTSNASGQWIEGNAEILSGSSHGCTYGGKPHAYGDAKTPNQFSQLIFSAVRTKVFWKHLLLLRSATARKVWKFWKCKQTFRCYFEVVEAGQLPIFNNECYQ